MFLNRRKLILLILSVILAALITLYEYSYFNELKEKEPSVRAVIASDDIKAGEKINNRVSFKEIPRSAFTNDMMSDFEDGYARIDISKGAYILKDMVSKLDIPVINDGMRKVTIKTDLVNGLAGEIRPGDYIDIGFAPDKQDNALEQGKIILKHVQIYEVVNDKGNEIERSGNKNINNQYDVQSLIPAAVTVIVSPDDGVLLKEYENKGNLFLIGY